MPSRSDLLRAHREALFAHNEVGRLVGVNEPGGKPAPRLFLGRTGQGNGWWFRDDLSDETIARLEAACRSIPDALDVEPPGISAAPFVAILERAAPVEKIWSGPAFSFPQARRAASLAQLITEANAALLRPPLDAWIPDVGQSAPLVAVVVGGQAVSVCASVRRTSVAHEAGVETAPAFRGRGYAAQAVSAWATAVVERNRLPLYSTSWDNLASRALARRLRLMQFSSDLHLT